MKRERVLRKEKQRLATELDKRIFFIEDLLSAVPIGILYRDETGKYIYANEEIGRILGISVDEIIGKQVNDIFPPDILQTTMESDERVQLTKKPTSDQISYGPE
jgi:two-component system aerobic respiration control sensor histidine kinase ArcB